MAKYIIVRGSDFNIKKPIFLQKSKIQNSLAISNKNIPWFNGDFSGAAIFETRKDAKRWDWLSIGEPTIMTLEELGIEEPKTPTKQKRNSLF